MRQIYYYLKFLLNIILLVAFTSNVSLAQDSKAMMEIIKSSEKIVKGAPFSAEAVSENVQMLADGNKIMRRTNTKMYRDSEGRFRRDDMPNPGGILGTMIEFPQTLFILDPIAGVKFYLNPAAKTARQSLIKRNEKFDSNYHFKIENENKKILEHKKAVEKQSEENKIKEKEFRGISKEQSEKFNSEKEKRRFENEVRKAENVARQTEISAKRAEIVAKQAQKNAERAEKNARRAEKWGVPNPPKPPNPIAAGTTKTESLGVKNIEGVEAEGTRTITTIAAGAIGNERPIDIVYERWYSKDLQLIVLSRHTDPRFGEQNYRLTNIRRSEPERSLFSLPADYKIVNPFPPKPPVPPKIK